MADRVRTTASVWLGATLGCAECHDHKFDPYTTRDFYSFGAFFADLDERGVYPNNRRPPELGLADGAKSLVSIPKEARPIRVLPRGNWLDESGEVVGPAIPAFLGRLEAESPTRIDLAQWLVSPDQPLTARVFVNRLWKLFFGKGVSARLDDLGSQGEWPVHPELLDWLAVDFVESGWDVKHLVRLLLGSEAYARASSESGEQRERDPENRLLSRQSRFRIEAEFVRDHALWVSGLLVDRVGGRSAKPYQPAGYWAHMNFPKRSYQHDLGEDQWRRGLYVHWQRTFLHPSLLAFDAPSREECTAERPISNTPQAALTLLNDPSFVEAARVFAAALLVREGEVEERLRWAFQRTTSRPASDPEIAVLRGLLDAHREHFAASPDEAARLISTGQKDSPPGLDPVEHAAWTSVARALLNLHEAITRS